MYKLTSPKGKYKSGAGQTRTSKKRNNSLKEQHRNHSSPPIQFYQNFKNMKEIQSAVHELKSAQKTQIRFMPIL